MPDEETSIENLIEIALDENDLESDVRWDSIRTLQKRGTREVFEAAKTLCESGNSLQVSLGADILGLLAVDLETGSLPFGEETSELLVRISATPLELFALDCVLIALGKTRTDTAIKKLLEFKSHESDLIRHAVTHGLLTQEDDDSIIAMIGLSNDEDVEVRNWATFGLGSQINIDMPMIREALFARLDDSDEVVRGEAFVGLAKRKDERILELLIKELRGGKVAEQSVEAADIMPHSRLCEPLKNLKKRWNENPILIDDAIKACCVDESTLLMT